MKLIFKLGIAAAVICLPGLARAGSEIPLDVWLPSGRVLKSADAKDRQALADLSLPALATFKNRLSQLSHDESLPTALSVFFRNQGLSPASARLSATFKENVGVSISLKSPEGASVVLFESRGGLPPNKDLLDILKKKLAAKPAPFELQTFADQVIAQTAFVQSMGMGLTPSSLNPVPPPHLNLYNEGERELPAAPPANKN